MNHTNILNERIIISITQAVSGDTPAIMIYV